MTDRELIDRLLFLAQTAVDQALDLNYDDPEDYFIYRELRELKAAALAQPEPQGVTDEDLHQLWLDLYAFHDGPTSGDVAEIARAVLARWGNPTPQPPAAGEVAELQRWGVDHGAQPGRPLLYPMEDGYWTPWHIANDLLQHQHPQPVAVSERLPEPGVKVLAHYFNALGKGRTICAIWVPAKSRSDEGDLDADDFLEYDEENDKYHWPEGWYEAIENWEDLGWARVYEGEVAYWQPLPKWPANALPTPEATKGSDTWHPLGNELDAAAFARQSVTVQGLNWPATLGDFTLVGPVDNQGAWRWYERQHNGTTERVRVDHQLMPLGPSSVGYSPHSQGGATTPPPREP